MSKVQQLQSFEEDLTIKPANSETVYARTKKFIGILNTGSLSKTMDLIHDFVVDAHNYDFQPKRVKDSQAMIRARYGLLRKYAGRVVTSKTSKKDALVVGCNHSGDSLHLDVIILTPDSVRDTTWSPNQIELHEWDTQTYMALHFGLRFLPESPDWAEETGSPDEEDTGSGCEFETNIAMASVTHLGKIPEPSGNCESTVTNEFTQGLTEALRKKSAKKAAEVWCEFVQNARTKLVGKRGGEKYSKYIDRIIEERWKLLDLYLGKIVVNAKEGLNAVVYDIGFSSTFSPDGKLLKLYYHVHGIVLPKSVEDSQSLVSTTWSINQIGLVESVDFCSYAKDKYGLLISNTPEEE